jgi:chitodextrinase
MRDPRPGTAGEQTEKESDKEKKYNPEDVVHEDDGALYKKAVPDLPGRLLFLP